jgi:hypothetical protein
MIAETTKPIAHRLSTLKEKLADPGQGLLPILTVVGRSQNYFGSS